MLYMCQKHHTPQAPALNPLAGMSFLTLLHSSSECAHQTESFLAASPVGADLNVVPACAMSQQQQPPYNLLEQDFCPNAINLSSQNG